jgi:hypothetical protein
MKRGNHVFIAASDLGPLLKEKFALNTNMYTNPLNSRMSVNFTDPSLREKGGYIFDKGLGTPYFTKYDTTATVLGRNDVGGANFLRYQIGRGSLYLLPDPRLLTNFCLLQPRGPDYVAKALSHVPKVQTLIWDENNTRGNVENSAVLRVIFQHSELRWAYCLALAGILLFVLFEMKRRQRVIPVMEKPLNSTVDFVRTVGRVYYEQRDNTDIALKKISYLLEFIRSQYGLKTAALDEEFVLMLAGKSGVSGEEVQALIMQIEHMQENARISDAQLIALNRKIENFYKQVR